MLSTANLETHGEKQIWERGNVFCLDMLHVRRLVGLKTEQNAMDTWRCRFQAQFWKHTLESYRCVGERGHFGLDTSSWWGVGPMHRSYAS